MICGNCQKAHGTVAEVRVCYGIARTGIENGMQLEAATQKQMDYINALRAERGLQGVLPDSTWHKRAASQEIERLRGIAKLAQDTYPEAGPDEEYERAIIRRQHPVAPVQVQKSAELWADIPAGHYAIDSLTGNNDMDFFRVDKPQKGKWAGYTFVKRVIGGKPGDVAVRGLIKMSVLSEIRAAGPEKAAQLYGQKLGYCCRCNRHLTDETSRQLGIGPECRSKSAIA